MKLFENFFLKYIFLVVMNYKTILLIDFISPVILSQRIRDVIIVPNGLKRFSKSCCVILFDKPDTYRLAPFIASELGRAKDTLKKTR